MGPPDDKANLAGSPGVGQAAIAARVADAYQTVHLDQRIAGFSVDLTEFAVVLFAGNADIHGLSLPAMRVGPEAGRKRYLRAEVDVRGPGGLIFAVMMELWPTPQTHRFFGYETAADDQNGPIDRRLS